ncbi:MAG: rubrerythrin family protein [Lachnospiraceae bacterium]|nr:rubrerythrin family protein [Lachnospiraceae bacterium]
MENNQMLLTNTCNFANVRPIMAALPYPPIRVQEKNQAYANLLSIDYCGSVSELSAITQYINNENRLSYKNCSMAGTILGIAMAEMMHLQKLGELIFLLGGTVDFTAKYRNIKPRMWTPEYLTIPEQAEKMLTADIEAEKAAINQYTMHMGMIRDGCVNAVLARIIKDEEYHIMLLQALNKELKGGEYRTAELAE